jgi:uncharacterized protein (TIGR03437 family)
MPANSNLPVITGVANASAGQQTLYPNIYASIYGMNLAALPGGVQVTLNGQLMTLQNDGVLNRQINFVIPASFQTGPAILRVFNGVMAANPIVVQIDVPPPTILSVTNASGVPYDATHAAASQDVVNVNVTDLDPTVFANTSRVQVTLNGQSVAVAGVLPGVNGQAQVSFVLTQGFGGAQVNLAVVVDGSSSVSVPIAVR